jgi:hypothetical protein
VAAALDFQDHQVVHLARGKYQWIDLKHFHIDLNRNDGGLLAALIGHDQYHDHYAGEDAIEQHHHALHGPYRLEMITPNTFQPSTGREATQVIESWANRLGPESLESQAQLKSLVLPLFNTGTVYRLPDIRLTAEHEWGWVVGQSGFHKFVVIDRERVRLTLLVASDD